MKMATTFIALIHKDPTSDYGVSFPDLPGCISAGRTMEEARRMAAEALALHLEGMMADNEPIPEPSPLDKVMSDPENRDGVAVLIPVPSEVGGTQRINISIPRHVLSATDHYAQANNMTRSAVIVAALKEKIGEAA